MGIQRRESSEKEDFVGVWTLLWFSCVLMNVKYVRWFLYPANGLGSPIWRRAIFLFFFWMAEWQMHVFGITNSGFHGDHPSAF